MGSRIQAEIEPGKVDNRPLSEVGIEFQPTRASVVGRGRDAVFTEGEGDIRRTDVGATVRSVLEQVQLERRNLLHQRLQRLLHRGA